MAGERKIEDTLKERGETYGTVHAQFGVAQDIKQSCREGLNNNNRWIHMAPKDQAVVLEALDMIAVKMSRIVVGDPRYSDNWHDIEGYARITDVALNPKDEI